LKLQKVYLRLAHLSVNQLERGCTDANIGSVEEGFGTETSTLPENLQALWCTKRSDCREMQGMPYPDLALEEERNSEVVFYLDVKRVLDNVSWLKAVFAQPFFIRGTLCPQTPIDSSNPVPAFTSSPQATPTTPS